MNKQDYMIRNMKVETVEWIRSEAKRFGWSQATLLEYVAYLMQRKRKAQYVSSVDKFIVDRNRGVALKA